MNEYRDEDDEDMVIADQVDGLSPNRCQTLSRINSSALSLSLNRNIFDKAWTMRWYPPSLEPPQHW